MFIAIKKLLVMAIPMASTRFVQTLTAFIMMLVLAQLGHTALAASFIISMLRIVVLLIFMSPLFAIGIIVGRQFAEKKHQHLLSILVQAWLLAVLLAVPPHVIICFYCPDFKNITPA